MQRGWLSFAVSRFQINARLDQTIKFSRIFAVNRQEKLFDVRLRGNLR